MDEEKIKRTNAHYRDQSEINLILELFQVQNEFSLMDGNSYLSFQKNKPTQKKTKKKHPEMNLQWGKHWTLAIVSTQQTEVQIEILFCGNVADFINRTWHF